METEEISNNGPKSTNTDMDEKNSMFLAAIKQKKTEKAKKSLIKEKETKTSDGFNEYRAAQNKYNEIELELSWQLKKKAQQVMVIMQAAVNSIQEDIPLHQITQASYSAAYNY
ncbi:hypothetical protein JTB14_030661 [Gonioctena quinquepunctata]|nr:hypothetical protein JTB14_030661 [Gonioctena quinquepunctata]